MTLGVRPPREASDLVNGGGVSGDCRSSRELICEHSFSVRDQVPPKGAHDFRQSFAAAKNGSCNDSVFRGVSQLLHLSIFPGFAGTPARLTKPVSCFWGFVLRIGADRLPQCF